MFEHNVVQERTINDAWRSALWCCVRKGHRYKTMGGSYEGMERLQLDTLQIVITEPWTRPLAVVTPDGMPAPTSDEAIITYFMDYLMTAEKAEGEDYTYGQFISRGINYVINSLNASRGNTNQACLNIGAASPTVYKDPPCLRVIDFKAVDDKLYMHIYFRSWDLFAGLPQNLGGLQLLKEYVLQHLTFQFEDGPIVAYSSGGHVYQMYYDLVDRLCVDKV